MASQAFSAGVYGIIEGNAPFQNDAGATAFSRTKPFPTPGIISFPTAGTTIHPLANGVQLTTGGFYVYSVIEVLPTGLNSHGTKYVSNASAATLAALAI